MPESGILVVDKPSGWTSHQVVGRCRRLLGTRRVGHAGTLDPMATGVLVIGVGKGTRLLGHLALTTKTYTARIRLGQATLTDDAEGEITSAPGAPGLSDTAIEAAIEPLRGDIVQVPSTVSAIKINGQRAYARARRGEDVVLAGRPVTVSRFDVRQRRDTDADGTPVIDLDVIVDCSSGTYIRALARDLGAALGTGGHLTALRRTRVGGFDLDGALTPEALTAEPPRRPEPIGLAEVARRTFACLELDADQARDVGYGRRLDRPMPADPTALLHAGELLALYRPDGNRGIPVAVLIG
ncbi:MAG: tRNA pseudouridine(55) synthase TruB [Micropruina sp.]|uniref:tRNA pseudouridine(55) synthase TruB n=1 Tax=Micropruina sp. TaxID=2737536 RepID=UPI0039E2955F